MSKGYCPACEKEVEYRFSDGSYFCCDCGRTKKAAEDKVGLDRKIASKKKRKKVLKIVALILFSCFMLIGFIADPDRMLAASGRGLIKGIALMTIGFIVIYFVSNFKSIHDEDD